jgi:hypothetical protein
MEIKTKQLAGAIALAITAATAHATPVYHPPGPNLTYGDVSNGQTIMSDITNPAAGAAALKKNGNQYRFGVLSSIGIGAEFGDVSDLYDRIDAEAKKFQDMQNIAGTSVQDAINLVDQEVTSLNSVLADVEAKGYAKAFVSAHAPLMPLVVAHHGLGGSLVLDFNGSGISKAIALHDNVDFNATAAAAGIDDPNDDLNLTINPLNGQITDFQVNNDSTLLVKAATTLELAVGYSRPVMDTDKGTLYTGLRGRYYQVGLARAGIRLGDLNDAEQAFKDAMDEKFTTDTGFGVDMGVLWIADHYRAGATLSNINEPSFTFGAYDTSGYRYPNSGVAAKITADNTYTMVSQLKLEAALFTKSQNWVISGAYDANAAKDPFGDEYQWLTASAAYATDSWLIPGFRIGYRKNMAGSELSYATVGATLFKVLNLDVAWGLEDVTINGSTVPRSFMANIGLEVTF